MHLSIKTFSKKSSQMTKVSFPNFKLLPMFSLRFLIFFFFPSQVLLLGFWVVVVVAASLRNKNKNKKQATAEKLDDVSSNARETIDKNIKFFSLLPTVVVVFMNVHRSPQQQHIDTDDAFLALASLFRRRMLCCFFPSSPRRLC